MNSTIRKYNLITAVLAFVIVPLIIMALGDAPVRSLLKEAISVATILAFFMMLLQFYLSRGNRNMLKAHRMGNVVKWHKVLAYIFVSVLLLHPFLIVLPRYFEAGIDPEEAFKTMLTTWDSRGIVLGLSAWILMLVLGLSSLFRKRLGMKYTTWRVFHGILSMLFIVLATWHATDLGRHTDLPMSIYMIALAAIAIFMLLRLYFIKSRSQA